MEDRHIKMEELSRYLKFPIWFSEEKSRLKINTGNYCPTGYSKGHKPHLGFCPRDNEIASPPQCILAFFGGEGHQILFLLSSHFTWLGVQSGAPCLPQGEHSYSSELVKVIPRLLQDLDIGLGCSSGHWEVRAGRFWKSGPHWWKAGGIQKCPSLLVGLYNMTPVTQSQLQWQEDKPKNQACLLRRAEQTDTAELTNLGLASARISWHIRQMSLPGKLSLAAERS